MKRLVTYFIALAFVLGFAHRAKAGLITFDPGNGEMDSLSITLDPTDGAIDGLAGATVGWGFSITWDADENYLSFTGSALTGETNGSFLSGYTDFIGANSGPDYIAMAPGTTWTQSFDPTQQTGVGAYAISSDPTLAVPGATDTGTIQFSFEVYYGYPTDPSAEDLGGFTYSGDTTAFAVSVDAPPPPPPSSSSLSSAPEPSSFALGLLAIAGIAFFATHRSAR